MSGSDMVEVCLAHPVKLGACWLDPGAHMVSPDDEAALKAAGVLDTSPDAAGPALAVITVTEAQFAEAVAAQAKALHDAVGDAAIEAACAKIIRERDTAVEGMEALHRKVEELQTELAAERIAHDETRAALAELQSPKAETAQPAPAQTDTPPSEKAAETAPKKGAAAKTKG